jgi:hypothetical protein
LLDHLGELSAEPERHPVRELRSFEAGRVGLAEREMIESHLDDCASCRDRIAEMRRSRRRLWAYVAATVVVAAVLTFVLPALRERRQGARPLRVEPASAAPPMSSAQSRYGDPQWDRLVADALRSGRLPFPPVVEALRVVDDVPRGEEGDRVRVAPAGVVTDDPRPRFSWPREAGATSIVFVFDGEQEIARSELLRRSEWTPQLDLPRGCVLAWQVEIARNGKKTIVPAPPSPPAFFQIITEEQQREIARAKQLHGDDPLLLAVLHARSGMREKARDYLLLAVSGGIPGAQKLLSDIND